MTVVVQRLQGDINAIDYDRLAIGYPEVAYDLSWRTPFD